MFQISTSISAEGRLLMERDKQEQFNKVALHRSERGAAANIPVSLGIAFWTSWMASLSQLWSKRGQSLKTHKLIHVESEEWSKRDTDELLCSCSNKSTTSMTHQTRGKVETVSSNSFTSSLWPLRLSEVVKYFTSPIWKKQILIG